MKKFQTPCGDSPLIIFALAEIVPGYIFVSNPLRGFTSNHLSLVPTPHLPLFSQCF